MIDFVDKVSVEYSSYGALFGLDILISFTVSTICTVCLTFSNQRVCFAFLVLHKGMPCPNQYFLNSTPRFLLPEIYFW